MFIEMATKAPWDLFFLIALFGGLGGLLFSFVSQESYGIKIPFMGWLDGRRKHDDEVALRLIRRQRDDREDTTAPSSAGEKADEVLSNSCDSPSTHQFSARRRVFDMGFFGHFFAGALSAMVVIALALPFTKLDLSPLFLESESNRTASNDREGPTSLEDEVFRKLIEQQSISAARAYLLYDLESREKLLHERQSYFEALLYVMAFSTIGGFAGLNLVSGLSRKLNEELRKQLKTVSDKSEQGDAQLAEAIKKALKEAQKGDENLNERLVKAQEELKRHKLESALARSREAIAAGFYHQALERAEESLQIEDTVTGRGLKAVALKRMGRVREALEITEGTLENLDPSEAELSLLLWNRGCYKALLGGYSVEDIGSDIKRAVDMNEDLVISLIAPPEAKDFEKDLEEYILKSKKFNDIVQLDVWRKTFSDKLKEGEEPNQGPPIV